MIQYFTLVCGCALARNAKTQQVFEVTHLCDQHRAGLSLSLPPNATHQTPLGELLPADDFV